MRGRKKLLLVPLVLEVALVAGAGGCDDTDVKTDAGPADAAVDAPVDTPVDTPIDTPPPPFD